MSIVLAVDEGTSSARALLINDRGVQLEVAQQSFEQFFPQKLWVEQNPFEIWNTQRAVIDEALRKQSLSPKDIRAIGITNQRETTIVWDKKTGLPIYNAIVWQDKRTARRCDELREQGYDSLVRERTGLVLDAYFSATKLEWILNTVPGARTKADAGELAFGTIDTWLIWNMTRGGVHVTDVSNASRTMLFNIHTMEWDSELLKLFNIPRAILPRVTESSEIVGEYLGIPIAGNAGDQQAALFGQRCKPGMMKNTYGTGCFMLLNTGNAPRNSNNKLVSTLAWKHHGKISYAHEGSVFMGGASVQWFRDECGFIAKSHEIEALAQSLPDNGGTYFVPAFEGLGAPHWNQYARPVMCGFPRKNFKAHLARAVEESIAYQVYDLYEAMCADFQQTPAEFRVDGGATRDLFLMQFQADILGVPVVRSAILESTAYGAAFLAGLAVGVWKNESELDSLWRYDSVFEPRMNQDQREANLAGWKAAVAKTL